MAAFRGVAGRDGSGLAEAVRFNRARSNSLLHEVVANRLGAQLREALVVFVAANAVGVSFHRDVQAGIRENDAGNFRQALAGSGSEFVTAAAEQDIRHIGDKSAGGVASRKNRVELLQEAFAKVLLLAFGLLA